MKYPEIKGICKKCLGCMRLESSGFNGVWRCEYYKEGQNDNNRNTNEVAVIK